MKFIIIFLILIEFTMADDLKLYKQEVKTLMNYTLKEPSNIYNMFIEKTLVQKTKKKAKYKIVKIKPKNTIKLLAILNSEICLKLNKTIKWAKEGDKIGDTKIVKILNNNSIIVLDNKKMKILSIKNKNNLKIKVR